VSLEDSGGAAVGAAVGVGMAAAQGGLNPVADMSAIISLVGLGTSIFGANKSAQSAKQATAAAQGEADSSEQQALLEKQVNAQRQQQMVLTSNRQQLQTIRNTQLARSMALTSATGQGANFGTGLQGGYGQISGDANTSLLGIRQNTEIGQNIFSLDNLIDDQKIRYAQFGAQLATAQGGVQAGAGLSALGGAIGKTAGPLSSLFGNAGGTSDTTGGMQSTFDAQSASTRGEG
jgi:hypothetical protein